MDQMRNIYSPIKKKMGLDQKPGGFNFLNGGFYIGAILFVSLFINSYTGIRASGSAASEAPKFYRGIYLNNFSARSKKKLAFFIGKAKKYNINAFVMDVQYGRRGIESMVSKDLIDRVKKAGIWPIARVVVFDQGFNHYPVKKSIIKRRIDTAEKAAKNGFGEIQFDYIRFADNRRLRKVTLKQRYQVVEGFLERAGKRLEPYNAIISADIYGRIPLNQNDHIGQRMEGLARVVDIISPMAYPSHYTWSKRLMADPFHTVFITSKRGHDRVKGEAEIVTWIQGFKLRVGRSRMSQVKYIREQIRATEKAGIRGYLVWNASQKYGPTWKALAAHYVMPTRKAGTKESNGFHEKDEG